jgi:hypothetical protein
MKCKGEEKKKRSEKALGKLILERGSATSYMMTGRAKLCLECQASNPVGILAWPGVPGSLRKAGATDENIPANVERKANYIGKIN